MSQPQASFVFEPQPKPSEWVNRQISRLLADSEVAQTLAVRLREQTGTRFADWVERITLPAEDDGELSRCGFIRAGHNLFVHPAAMLPVVELGSEPALSLRVEDVDAVRQRHEVHGETLGAPFAPTRAVRLTPHGQSALWATERHQGRLVTDFAPLNAETVRAAQRVFRDRPRSDADPATGFRAARELVSSVQSQLPKAYVCDLFFAAERNYWLSRNDAARFQKSRQDALGFGWGNHDHHTYRSSRQHFAALVSVLEKLGLTCRERFYAGPEAGWGAQVMEHPESGLMVFADVDLGPDEVLGDFSHDGLQAATAVGTVGLWCALHGEAFLEAGMHHLEAQFDFEEACRQLGSAVGVMPPFTDFGYLRQCFTMGQLWPVDPARARRAQAAGWISAEQARLFERSGALGSHLEILERNQGFGGFNQTGISDIIRRTDPRRASAE